MTVLTRIMGSRSHELSGFQTTRILPSPEAVADAGSSSPPTAAGVGLYTSTRWMMNFDDPAFQHRRRVCMCSDDQATMHIRPRSKFRRAPTLECPTHATDSHSNCC